MLIVEVLIVASVSNHFGVSMQRLHQFLDGTQFAAGLPLFGGLQNFNFDLRRQINAKAIDRHLGKRLFARLHNAGERSVARFIEPQVSRYNCREWEGQRFQTAVSLAYDSTSIS